MRVSEMNARQKKAFYNIKYAAYHLLGELEYAISDNAKDSEKYIQAKELLSDHKKLVDTLYDWAVSDVYGKGFVQSGIHAQKLIRDINFCGKEWLMERCDARIKKEGY